MSFCQYCGKAVKPGGNFCGHCGANLQGPPTSVPVPSQTTVLSVSDSIRKLAASLDATIEDKGGVLILRKAVAERRAFLSTKRLEYSAKIRVTDSSREVTFTEMLKESGSGLGGMDVGAGFKAESYSTGFGGQRDGGIVEQSKLFGKKFSYSFNWGEIRSQIEHYATDAGYSFVYQITPSGF